MKKILWSLLLTGLLPVVCHSAQKVTETPISSTATVGFSQSLDMSAYDRASVQVVYSPAGPAQSSVSDGNFSSATLSVNSFSLYAGQASSATFTLVNGKNNSGISGALISINGLGLTEGSQWFLGATSTVTWNSLLAAVTTYGNMADYNASVSSNVLTVVSRASSTLANSWIITSSTLPAISTSAFVGGQPNGTININGTILTAGTDFTAQTSSQVTAINISTSINANTTLNTLVTASTQALGVVRMVSKLSGYNPYYISVSSDPAIHPSFPQFTGGANSDISVAGDTISKTNHGFSTGLQVLLSTTVGSAPTGLTIGTTYYAIKVDANTYSLATTSTTAVAGTAIDITAVAGGSTIKITPLALSIGSAGFLWKGSNDGVNFSALSISSVTYSAAGTTLWDLGEYAYKYFQMVFTGPTSGGISLVATVVGWLK